MSEEMSRALGANGAMTVTIAGKACSVRALGLKELLEVERDCLTRARRNYLETFSKNLDLLTPEQAGDLMAKKLEEVARWDVSDLPHKTAYDGNRVFVNQEIKDLARDRLGLETDKSSKFSERQWKRVVSAMLDQGVINPEEYQRITGKVAPSVKIPYVNWWITGCYDGMVSFVWTCFRHNGVTRDEVVDAFQGNLGMLIELAHEIERLSSPDPKNG